MAAELLSENMFDIFSRTPVKSLARFRCVSKQWRDNINDSYLETMHVERASNNPMLIMFQQFPSSDHLNSPSPCSLGFLERNDQETGLCALEVKTKAPVMEFICKSSGSRYPDDIVLGSCNGLIYSSNGHRDATTLVVINPLRKECYELPPIITPFHSQHLWLNDLVESFRVHVKESYGLGFDESTNTFKMVSIVRTREEVSRSRNFDELKEELCTMVHVLGTGSWRKIAQVPSYYISGEGVFANGCLHWLISDEDDDERETYLGRPVIRFDMAREEFGLIDPPQERPSGWVKEQLVDLNGEVGYVYNIVNNVMEVWILKERGWVMHCEFEQKPPLPRGFIKVLGFWNENGDILMTDDQKKMFVYNLKSDGLYEVSFVGREEGSTIDVRMYQSSLFSTRYSIKNR